MSALADLIQEVLDVTGMTVAEVARKGELTPQLLYGWLNGTRIVKTPMRPETAAGLAYGLGVPEVVVWDATLKDLGSSTRLVPDDLSPTKGVLIASIANLPDAEAKRIARIVTAALDSD